MQFRILTEIDSGSLDKVVPPAFRSLARDIAKLSARCTVILFRHDINDVVRSTLRNGHEHEPRRPIRHWPEVTCGGRSMPPVLCFDHDRTTRNEDAFRASLVIGLNEMTVGAGTAWPASTCTNGVWPPFMLCRVGVSEKEGQSSA